MQYRNICDLTNDNKDKQRELVVRQLGIFELRALGRKLGIKSPTTLKRDTLLTEIIDKLYNGSEPIEKTTKKGRPCKELSNIEDIMSTMTGLDEYKTVITATKKVPRYSDIVTFAQEKPVFSEVIKESCEFTGVLRVSNKTGYLIDKNNNAKVFMNLESVKQSSLKPGDFLDVEATKINSNNQYMISALYHINFEDAEGYKDTKVSEGTAIICYDKIKYGNGDITRGRRNVISYSKNVFEDMRFLNFAKRCEEENLKLVILSLNTSFEDQIMFNNTPDSINMVTSYGSDYEEGLERVVDTIALVQRQIERGQKVVVFVNDIIEVLNCLDLCFESSDKINGHCTQSVVIAQKLLSLGRAIDNGSEATIVMTYRDFNKKDEFLVNEIFKISTLVE